MNIKFDDSGNCFLNGGATIINKEGYSQPMVKINLTLESLSQALNESEGLARNWESKKSGESFRDVTILAMPRKEQGNFRETHYLKIMDSSDYQSKTEQTAPPVAKKTYSKPKASKSSKSLF